MRITKPSKPHIRLYSVAHTRTLGICRMIVLHYGALGTPVAVNVVGYLLNELTMNGADDTNLCSGTDIR